MTDRFPEQGESDLTYLVDQKNGDRMIKQLLSEVEQNIVICQCLWLRQIIDRLRQIIDQLFANN